MVCCIGCIMISQQRSKMVRTVRGSTFYRPPGLCLSAHPFRPIRTRSGGRARRCLPDVVAQAAPVLVSHGRPTRCFRWLRSRPNTVPPQASFPVELVTDLDLKTIEHHFSRASRLRHLGKVESSSERRVLAYSQGRGGAGVTLGQYSNPMPPLGVF